MELLTNPIDLMNYMHRALRALAQYFWSGTEDFSMSFDDTMPLFLPLMLLIPPANALGIAEYVNLWESVQISGVLSLTKTYFVCAVGRIQGFGRERVS
jgi:hypothetical protein